MINIDYISVLDEYRLSQPFIHEMYDEWILGIEGEQSELGTIAEYFIPFVNFGDSTVCTFRFYERQHRGGWITYYVYFNSTTGECLASDISKDEDIAADELRSVSIKANRCFKWMIDNGYLIKEDDDENAESSD